MIPPKTLLGAYTRGIFPMAEDGQLYWFSPEKRGLIPVDERFHLSRGLRKALRKEAFDIRQDTDFEGVMRGCSEREETWIDDVILGSYCRLFLEGYAHSFEAWDEEGLQGGLYGVRVGNVFFGESMFSRKTDASKIALVSLVEWMRKEKMSLLDTQWLTEHLKQFGGYEIDREDYLQVLDEALGEEAEPFRLTGWLNFSK